MGDDERVLRTREEEEREAEGLEQHPHLGPGKGIVSDLDRIAAHAAGATSPGGLTAEEAAEVEPGDVPVPEAGRGRTITLTEDDRCEMRAGEEVAVRLPDDGSGGADWTYDIDGDAHALEVDERAQVVHGGRLMRAPGASGGSQFLLRAAGRGRATVRFERVDRGGAGRRPLRLQVRVR